MSQKFGKKNSASYTVGNEFLGNLSSETKMDFAEHVYTNHSKMQFQN